MGKTFSPTGFGRVPLGSLSDCLTFLTAAAKENKVSLPRLMSCLNSYHDGVRTAQEAQLLADVAIKEALHKSKMNMRAEVTALANERAKELTLKFYQNQSTKHGAIKRKIPFGDGYLTVGMMEILHIINDGNLDGTPTDLYQIVERGTVLNTTIDGIHFILRPLMLKGLIDRGTEKRGRARRATFTTTELAKDLIRKGDGEPSAEFEFNNESDAILAIDAFFKGE